VLREHIHIDGLPLHIVDTAGLRASEDQIEQEGMRRTWQQITGADRVLLIIDDCAGLGADEQAIIEQLPEGVPLTVVHNKIDLSRREPLLVNEVPPRAKDEISHLWLSAKTGAGMNILRTHLKDSSGYQQTDAGIFTARRRHLDALQRAQHNLRNGTQQLHSNRAGELLAEELRQAQNALSEITGAFGADDLLGRIFAGFCIGK
ncbi:MAG: GTPase, partial [Gammaproteobacteria bacterium]